MKPKTPSHPSHPSSRGARLCDETRLSGALLPSRMRPLMLLAALGIAAGGMLGQPAHLDAQVTEPPPPLAERSIEFPDFQEFTLDNGLRVVILPYGTQPVMSARLYVPGGRAYTSPDRAGMAELTAEVLTRGTESRTAAEISEAIEGVGGSLSASAGQDFFTVSTTALVEHMDTAFDLLQDVVRQATFPDDEVELARRQYLSGLQAQLGQPQSIVQRRFSAVVYGEDHPYGWNETPASVESITRDEISNFRDEVLHPSGALLLVAGQVDASEVEERVRRHLSDWDGRDRIELEFPDPPVRDEARIYLVHRPGSVQSVFGVGHIGVPPGHPDYFPLVVMNRVLGGGADSRLFQILREERGWTYGAYSQLTRPADVGVWRAITEVRTEVTDSTLVELLHQMERIREEPVPPEELDAARNYMAGSFPLRLETADQVAGQLATPLLLDLSLDDVTRYPERIRAVSGEEVQRVAREHLHPDRAAIIVVGDGAQILEKLEGIAPIELFDIRGEALTRDDVLGQGELTAWDASRLQEGIRRYDLYFQGNPMGSAEYRLEEADGIWTSSSVLTSPAGSQESLVRFSAEDFAPLGLEQELSQGPADIRANVRVEAGRLMGDVQLPEQLGGPREYDQELAPGVLLPGMEELVLSVADLEDGARFSIPYIDLTRGEQVTLEARVTGRESIQVSAGSFETWVVELSGGDTPLTLYLRVDAPHVMIRQEFQGQPVRLDLTSLGSL